MDALMTMTMVIIDAAKNAIDMYKLYYIVLYPTRDQSTRSRCNTGEHAEV
jgi:hypothetical protein